MQPQFQPDECKRSSGNSEGPEEQRRTAAAGVSAFLICTTSTHLLRARVCFGARGAATVKHEPPSFSSRKQGFSFLPMPISCPCTMACSFKILLLRCAVHLLMFSASRLVPFRSNLVSTPKPAQTNNHDLPFKCGFHCCTPWSSSHFSDRLLHSILPITFYCPTFASAASMVVASAWKVRAPSVPLFQRTASLH